jgi:hypothetical protein
LALRGASPAISKSRQGSWLGHPQVQ